MKKTVDSTCGMKADRGVLLSWVVCVYVCVCVSTPALRCFCPTPRNVNLHADWAWPRQRLPYAFAGAHVLCPLFLAASQPASPPLLTFLLAFVVTLPHLSIARQTPL